MNNQHHNLPEQFAKRLESAKQMIALTAEEARDLRGRLSDYADLHAVPAKAVQSPYTTFFYSRAFTAALLIVLIVLGTGAGVTYAAGNALPGQPLYAVKVNVAEPIQGAVIAATSGTEGSAEWQNRLAERRITEAATLAAQNDLSSSTATYLKNQTTLHVAQSEDDTAKLAAAGNTGAANQVRLDLAARLSAHARLLALIAPRLAEAGDASTTDQVATLLQTVSQAQTDVLLGRDNGESQGSEAGTSTASSSSVNASTTVTLALDTDAAAPAFHAAEQRFFEMHANILNLLPRAASSTATSTATTTALTTPLKHQEHEHEEEGSGLLSSTTITATGTINFPSSDSSESEGNDN